MNKINYFSYHFSQNLRRCNWMKNSNRKSQLSSDNGRLQIDSCQAFVKRTLIFDVKIIDVAINKK